MDATPLSSETSGCTDRTGKRSGSCLLPALSQYSPIGAMRRATSCRSSPSTTAASSGQPGMRQPTGRQPALHAASRECPANRDCPFIASEIQFGFPALDGDQLVYGTVETVGGGPETEFRLYLFDLADRNGQPRRLDTSGDATQPATSWSGR